MTARTTKATFYDKRLERLEGWMALKATWDQVNPESEYVQQLTAKINRLRLNLGIVS